MIVGAIAIVAAAAAILVLGSRGDEPRAGSRSVPRGAVASPASELAPAFVQAGEVLVTIEPVRIDGEGAVFRVGFETHTVELSLDVAKEASLEVDGTRWPNATWSGSPAGGHHRDGKLRFDAGGASTGEAVLTIDGLADPVVASWALADVNDREGEEVG